MDNLPNDTNFEKKIINELASNALTSTAIVNIDFTAPKENTITITQDTTFNITGVYKQNDVVYITVTGNYLVYFIQSGFVFKGTFLSSGWLTSYENFVENEIAIRCVDVANKKFTIMNNPLYA